MNEWTSLHHLLIDPDSPSFLSLLYYFLTTLPHSVLHLPGSVAPEAVMVKHMRTDSQVTFTLTTPAEGNAWVSWTMTMGR